MAEKTGGPMGPGTRGRFLSLFIVVCPVIHRALTDGKCLTFSLNVEGEKNLREAWALLLISPLQLVSRLSITISSMEEENAVCSLVVRAPAPRWRKQAWTLPVEAVSCPSPSPGTGG